MLQKAGYKEKGFLKPNSVVFEPMAASVPTSGMIWPSQETGSSDQKKLKNRKGPIII